MTTHEDYPEYVNLQTLHTLSAVMGEVFDELIPAYLESADKCFNEAAGLIDQGDLETAERLFHSLKSSSRNLGAMPLGGYAEQLESTMREKRIDELEPDFSQARDMYQQVRKILLEFQESR